MTQRDYGIHTKAIHGGERPDPTTGAVVPPLYQSTTYHFESAEEAAATVDLNSATQAELETLPGIGPARAKSIIDYRAEHRFRRVEDVMKVPGIGPGIFARIQDRIVVH